MNTQEALEMLSILKVAYPNGYKLNEKEAVGTVNLWAAQFADLPADIVMMAVNKHISISPFPPSICEIKKQITAVHWEAYEIQSDSRERGQLTAHGLKQIERIYELTKRYRYEKCTEPKLIDMLSSRNAPMMIAGKE